ncbi:hypothetical protein CALVIDRAFT_543072 [Calocera viscosa TUFC12733]|uniref:Uncharacterized protein n=1 Tax=Calocera viscosa (strain TUFC12733) TaxID=1330018 RepID=A0A167FFD7_CALVF|nr:hypothetical protein CALVIDRAFT_543556 [Calocera viscosa TUFC12733]KZO90028.1 hypothetical protein CALVIDRAFT_543072 [Calocera viscosa TUFC12733]
MNEHTRKLAPVKLLQQFALNRALAIAQLRELDRVMLHISSAYDTMLDHTNVGLILAEWIMGAYETEPAWLVKL